MPSPPKNILDSKELQNDKEFILKAVSQDVRALQHASKELQNDKEFILKAVSQDARALHYASKELQNDKEVILKAVSQDVRALEFASKELQNDKEFILKAVSQNGQALEFASKELQNDKEVVLKAVSQNGRALKFASKEFFNLEFFLSIFRSEHSTNQLEYQNFKAQNAQNDADFIYSYFEFIKENVARLKKVRRNSDQLLQFKWSFLHKQEVIVEEFIYSDRYNLVTYGDNKNIKYNGFDIRTVTWRNSKIRKIPVEIFKFSKLQFIQMTNCGIREVPQEMYQMKELTTIDLSKNEIREISTAISFLGKLVELNLSNNQLQEISPGIFNLENLEKLSVDNNFIREIPSNISKLKKLTILNISNNGLQNFPIVEMNFCDIDISGNPMNQIFQEFKNHEKFKTELLHFQYETRKLVILGDGKAGKTCLTKKIISGKSNEGIKSTEVINIEKWKINDGFEFLIHDFGGQEHYKCAYPIFLNSTKRFLLVYNMR